MTESGSMSEQGITEPPDPKREEAIREQAYALWHEQGQPEGKDREHWLQAEREHDGHDDRVSASAAPSTEAQGALDQRTLGTSTPVA